MRILVQHVSRSWVADAQCQPSLCTTRFGCLKAAEEALKEEALVAVSQPIVGILRQAWWDPIDSSSNPAMPRESRQLSFWSAGKTLVQEARCTATTVQKP